MRVKTSKYTKRGYIHREGSLSDAVSELINKTQDGYVLSELIEILAEKNILNQQELNRIFSAIDVDVEILDQMFF